MSKVLIYTTPWCPYCTRAKQLLQRKQVSYDEIDVSRDGAKRDEMEERSGRYTVPQIFIDDRPIGGCDDLYELEATGQLDALLSPSDAAAT